MLGAMQKVVHFHHKMEIDMLNLGCTLPNLANIRLHKSTAASFCPFTKSDKDSLEKNVKTWLVDLPFFLQRKLFWTKFVFVIQQTVAKPSSKLTLVSFVLTLCVKRCLRLCAWDGSLILNLTKSSCFKARRGVFKTCSCHTFRESDHSVKWRVATWQAHREKMLLLLLMVFVETAKSCLKLWNGTIIFVPLKSLVFFSAWKKFNEALNREDWTNYENNIYKERV